jgi:5-methylcytosine-specific restriction endonuclease McrA
MRTRKRREQRRSAGLVVDPLTPHRAAKNRAKANEWYHANKERAAESVRSYRQTPRGRAVHQTSNMLRRARIRGAAGSCSVEQLQARIDYYGGLCSYCKVSPFEHVDHAIPVARGGTNWPSNLRPACSDCNLRKWTKTAMEFLA